MKGRSTDVETFNFIDSLLKIAVPNLPIKEELGGMECNILAEYAVKIQGEHASEAYFKEHYEVLIPDHALENLIKV